MDIKVNVIKIIILVLFIFIVKCIKEIRIKMWFFDFLCIFCSDCEFKFFLFLLDKSFLLFVILVCLLLFVGFKS